MGMKSYFNIGIFLELNLVEDRFENYKTCNNKENIKCENQQYGLEVNFCQNCGKETIIKQKYIDTTPVNIYDVVKEIGLNSRDFGNCGEISDENQKYFIYENKIPNVKTYNIEEHYEYFMSLNINEQELINEAMKDEKFRVIVDKFKFEFGDKFKVHYGLYTQFH
jgi:hypothetical protein